MESTKSGRNKRPVLHASTRAVFTEVTKESIIRENPDIPKTDLYKQINSLWEQLSPEEIDYYRKLADEKTRKLNRSKKKSRNDLDNEDSDSERLKKVSTFHVFQNEMHSRLKNERTDLSLQERSALIREMWENISKEEKDIYINKMKRVNRKLQKPSTDEYDMI